MSTFLLCIMSTNSLPFPVIAPTFNVPTLSPILLVFLFSLFLRTHFAPLLLRPTVVQFSRSTAPMAMVVNPGLDRSDIQKRATQLQRGSSALKQGYSQRPRIKEEEKELWNTQDMGDLLRPEETEDHEDKPPESSCWLCPSDDQQLIGHQEERPTLLQGGSSTLKREDPQLPHVKEEEEELWITQEGECLPGPKLPLIVVSVKTEDHEDKPLDFSQLHHCPSEENREVEPPSSRSPQHMTTEADGDHCGGSQADKRFAPLSDSDDTTSHSPEDEDGDDTQESLSSDTDCEVDRRTHTDNKHSECSQKKTDIQQHPHVKEEEEESQPPHVKEEEEELWSPQEECFLGPEGADLTKLPLTVVSVKIEDHKVQPPESLPSLCPSDVQQLIGHEEESLPKPQGGSSTLMEEDPQPHRFKEEQEELWTTQEGKCFLGLEEADLTQLPLTVVSVKTEDEEQRQADKLLAPLSDSDHTTSGSHGDEDRDNTQEPLCRDTDWEGDIRTHTDNKHSETDFQQLIGHHKQRPKEPQGGSTRLKQEAPQPPHVKEEEGELKVTHEGECLLWPETDYLSKLPLTVVSVKTEDHEDKPHESLRWLCPSDVQQLIGHQKEHPAQPQVGGSTLKQEDPQPPHVKKEEEELWITQEGECFLGPKEANLTKLPLTGVSVKTEDDEDKPPESSQLHHSPSEEHRGAKPPSSRSPQHMTTEADGDHCGGSQADKLLAPLSDSDDTTSHSSEDEDRDGTQEPLSSDTDCEGDMRTHTQNKHSECSKKKKGKKCVTCSVCAKSHLTRHMPKHTSERPFACSLCGKSYSYRRGLTYHMLTHTGEKPFGCSVCGHRFFQKSRMVTHMRKHTGEKPYSCSVCAKNFSSKPNLTHHMLKKHTGVKHFDCSVCGKRFQSKSSMVSHMTTHTREKRFSCSICGKIYSYKRSLTYHMATHREKPFGCSICGQRFFYKSVMVSHVRKHTGEKPFGCSVCGQRFPRKSSMVSHMAKHTGQKPFGCTVCGKGYSYKHLLNVHMVTHKGEKLFDCSVCGERHSQKSHMVSLRRTHSREKVCPIGSGSTSDSQPKHYWNQKGFEWSF
ncbi:zinc finger protein 37-like isoform X3 [Dunckerocampus dactyliophorus]|uniref:zinc finger protein 37-like isoform X3 n=1 Tax=Dunckerocampus dactyliophorus TaxID=161453 RepID=UPI0024057D30|nr:zinc finger protein 37-like isoform X3 [Dunckerocampus dactyliophorus]